MTSSVISDSKEPPAQARPGYMTQADLDRQRAEEAAHKAVDQTTLISDLSHQLEVVRIEYAELVAANRHLEEQIVRHLGARDALKELLVEAMKR